MPATAPAAEPHPDTEARAPAPVKDAVRQGAAHTAAGVNIASGQDDDGWVVPRPVTLGNGTRVQLYKDGEGLLAAYKAIESARRLVCLEVYIFAEDDTGRAFAELLGRKSREGVRVYVIYDSFGSRGLGGAEPQMFREMRRSGVRVRQFNPIRPWECSHSWRPVNRDHRKLLVVDSDIAGLGGLNVGAEYGGRWVIKSRRACEPWRDNAISVIGPGARLFLEAFKRTWRYIENGGRIRSAEFSHDLYDGELGVMATVATLNSPLLPFLYRTMREARRSILLTMAYFAPDNPLIDELCDAARRGVRVRLMLPGRCDVPLVRLAARSFYETLLGAGVEVYERQGAVLHAKLLVADAGTTVIGSTNLDYRSIEYNCEISAVIRSPEFGRQMHDLFENDVGFARRILLSEWRRRPGWDRFVQWAVSRARYLM